MRRDSLPNRREELAPPEDGCSEDREREEHGDELAHEDHYPGEGHAQDLVEQDHLLVPSQEFEEDHPGDDAPHADHNGGLMGQDQVGRPQDLKQVADGAYNNPHVDDIEGFAPRQGPHGYPVGHCPLQHTGEHVLGSDFGPGEVAPLNANVPVVLVESVDEPPEVAVVEYEGPHSDNDHQHVEPGEEFEVVAAFVLDFELGVVGGVHIHADVDLGPGGELVLYAVGPPGGDAAHVQRDPVHADLEHGGRQQELLDAGDVGVVERLLQARREADGVRGHYLAGVSAVVDIGL